MSSLWSNIKKSLGNANDAWQQTQKNMYTAPKPVTVQTANKTAPKSTASAGSAGTNGSYGISGREDSLNKQGGIQPVTTAKTDAQIRDIYSQAQQQRYQAALSAKLSAAQQAKNAATGIVQNRYSNSQQAADSQLKDAIGFADKQKQLMQQQRRLALADSQRASALAAENSLRDAYISYMLAGRNLPQQLKALGVSGGLSETTAANLTNTYQNSRNAANLEKAAADRQAQLVYDTGLNQDALRYNQLVKEYTDDYNAAIAAARNAYTQGLLAAEKDYASAANAINAAYKNMIDYGFPRDVIEQYKINRELAKPVLAGRSER